MTPGRVRWGEVGEVRVVRWSSKGGMVGGGWRFGLVLGVKWRGGWSIDEAGMMCLRIAVSKMVSMVRKV